MVRELDALLPARAPRRRAGVLEDDPQVYAYTRAYEGTELLVIVNVSGEPAEIPAKWGDGELVLTNAEPEPQGLELGPWEARVYRRVRAPRSA